MSGRRSIFKVSVNPRHSHSIVSGTYKDLKERGFYEDYAKLTVRSTAKTFRLGAIDGDRRGRGQSVSVAARPRTPLLDDARQISALS